MPTMFCRTIGLMRLLVDYLSWDECTRVYETISKEILEGFDDGDEETSIIHPIDNKSG